MALHLITGYAGREHITSSDQGAYNAATFGGGEFVLDRGRKFEHTVLSNNAISIADGEAMMQGRYIKMPSGTSESVTIENGTQGNKRNDLICIRYSKDPSTSVESASLVVIKGTPTTGTPTDPEYTSGDITDGTDNVADFPLYRVSLDGININSVTSLFNIKTSMVDYMDNYQLKPATPSILGGIKTGAGLVSAADGTTSLQSMNADFVYATTNAAKYADFNREIGLLGGIVDKFGRIVSAKIETLSYVPTNGIQLFQAILKLKKAVSIPARGNTMIYISGTDFENVPTDGSGTAHLWFYEYSSYHLINVDVKLLRAEENLMVTTQLVKTASGTESNNLLRVSTEHAKIQNVYIIITNMSSSAVSLKAGTEFLLNVMRADIQGSII